MYVSRDILIVDIIIALWFVFIKTKLIEMPEDDNSNHHPLIVDSCLEQGGGW